MLRLRTDKGNIHELSPDWKFIELLTEEGTLGAVVFTGDDGMVFILHEGCKGREQELWEKYVESVGMRKAETINT